MHLAAQEKFNLQCKQAHVRKFINSLSSANTLAADGIHHVHFTGAGRSEGFGGNSRREMNCKQTTNP